MSPFAAGLWGARPEKGVLRHPPDMYRTTMNPFSNLLRYLQSNSVPFVVDGIPSIPAGVEPRGLSVLADARRVTVSPVQLDDRVWLAVMDDSRRLHPDLVRRSFGGRVVARVHDEDLPMLFPGCDLKAIPPLGNLFGVPIMIDESIADSPALSFAAYDPEVCVTLRTSDFRTLAKPVVAEIAVPLRASIPHS